MKRGFTLIELLVVVAIIAVLMALLMPSLAKARAQAKTVACSSQMHQIGLAFAMYQSENTGMIPDLVYGYSGGSKTVSIVTASSYTDRPWDYLLLGYMNNSANKAPLTFRCPFDELPRTFVTRNNPPQSYILNRDYVNSSSNPMPNDAGSPANKKITNIPAPADLVLVACFGGAWERLGSDNSPIVGLSSQHSYSYGTLHNSPQSYNVPPYLFMNHSGDGSNYLKCDGHVEYLRNANMLGKFQPIAGPGYPASARQWRMQN